MNDGRWASSHFCDDIRQERGGKYSLMGCYAGEAIIDTFPAVLPKFCTEISAGTPIAKPFTQLLFRAFLGENQIAELELPPAALQTGHEQMRARMHPDSKGFLFRAIMMFVPLILPTECWLRVEAITEEGSIPAGRIEFRARRPEDPVF